MITERDDRRNFKPPRRSSRRSDGVIPSSHTVWLIVSNRVSFQSWDRSQNITPCTFRGEVDFLLDGLFVVVADDGVLGFVDEVGHVAGLVVVALPAVRPDVVLLEITEVEGPGRIRAVFEQVVPRALRETSVASVQLVVEAPAVGAVRPPYMTR